MSDVRTLPAPSGRGFVALAAGVAVGLFVGFLCGLTLARRMVPVPTESRLVMQLLALEQASLMTRVQAGQCAALAPVRMRTLLVLVDLIPLSMRDTLAIDAAFEGKVRSLKRTVQRLADSGDGGCQERRRLLAAIDTACRNCHLEFRTGESQ